MRREGQQSWTVSSLLGKTTGYLRDKGCETARLDAEVLLGKVLGLSRVELYARFERPVLAGEVDSYRALIRRRAQGEPAAYLVGVKEFYSLKFALGPGVLVPRPETEFLVAAAVEEAKAAGGRSLRAADIGTGSGCVAVALAVYAPNCEVVATEPSGVAAEFARRNAAAHDVQDRVTVADGEVFKPLRKMGLEGRLDMVLSNPPYVSEGEYEKLPVTVRDYEPREALVAGEGGVGCHRKIAGGAPDFLVKGGLLALEVGQGQFERVAQIIEGVGAFSEPRAVEDYGRIKRVILVRRN